jgi:hypothetical protein
LRHDKRLYAPAQFSLFGGEDRGTMDEMDFMDEMDRMDGKDYRKKQVREP